MHILNSDWLIKMLEKSSKTPLGRLISLFDILEDWLDAPNINTQLQKELDNHLDCKNLRRFLALEAAKAGAAMPEMLANQLYFMAIAAMQEQLNNQNLASLSHAKSAASALVLAQTRREFHIKKTSAYAMAASFLGVLVVIGSLFTFNLNSVNFLGNQRIAAHGIATHSVDTVQTNLIPEAVNDIINANPEDTAALIAQINQMRNGNCQLIEALQLPDSYKKVYFENIVLGQISTNVADQKLVHQLLDKVRCNYTPMLMANSR